MFCTCIHCIHLGPNPESNRIWNEHAYKALNKIVKQLEEKSEMGNWNINIQGVGSHHNKDYPKDADKMAAEFVQKLKDAGHNVESATFTYGGKNDIQGVK